MDCRTLFLSMPGRFDPAAAGDWKASIQFRIGGPRGGDFTLRVADGACTVDEGDDPAASTRVEASDDTWLGIVDGSVNPMTAFMMGKVKIKGDMGAVLKLQDPKLFRRD
ncbi:MAG TPA: SCP2 sterol-binding domain-containing protein [Candidatus Krumholzibacteria bacterium]|nr:SCP2 sterol-binding domain-containing protein [Candidatus Krumholzibacteria bacterium]